MRSRALALAFVLVWRMSVLAQTDPSSVSVPAESINQLFEPDLGDGRYLASLETRQGESVDRLAVFENGVVDFRWFRPGRPFVKNRMRLPKFEMETIRRVLKEGAALNPAEAVPSQSVLSPGRRQFRLQLSEVVAGESRVFEFDEMRPVPLALGRVRGAMEDLKGRLAAKEVENRAKSWDPAQVTLGDRLVRRSDGLVFEVTTLDPFGNLLELEETARHLERTKIRRAELPAHFQPLTEEAEPVPGVTPTPRPEP